MKSDFYFEFENQFRGAREDILARLSSYDGLIKHIINNFDNPKMLDIGSGRGEWIEKCTNAGIQSFGLEVNQVMIEYCQKKGFNIIAGDALKSLQRFQSDSFSIISGFHIIEHLKHNEINSLLEECKRILMPDGVLILETPSIDNLQVSSRTFYIDPTHITPINPDSLTFVLDRIGFDTVKYYFINGDSSNASYNFHSMKDVLSASGKDVLFIATISNEINKSLFNYEHAWSKTLKLAKSTQEIASIFDEELKTVIRDQANKISILETNLEFLKFRQDRLFNNIFAKIYRKSKLIILNLLNPIKRLILNFSHLVFKLLLRNSTSSKSLFMLKISSVILRILRLKTHSSRLINKVNEANHMFEESSRLNNRLIDHYYSSNIAQQIYEQIISRKNKR